MIGFGNRQDITSEKLIDGFKSKTGLEDLKKINQTI